MPAPIEDFDPTPYTRPPVIDVAGGVALAVALIHAAPKGAGPGVDKALNKLRNSAVGLQKVWSERDRLGVAEDPRPADQEVDHAWSAFFARLDAYAQLPAARHPKAARAAKLRDSLFPDGLKFLTANYEAEWAESQKRLDRVDREKLAAELDTLTGREFLAELRIAHKRYGEVVNITKAGSQDAGQVVGPLRALARAIPVYALRVIAAADLDTENGVSGVRAALLPIDAYRAAAAGRAAGQTQPPAPSPAPVTPATPIPAVSI